MTDPAALRAAMEETMARALAERHILNGYRQLIEVERLAHGSVFSERGRFSLDRAVEKAWPSFLEEVRTALAAQAAVMREHGWKMLPREPTIAMAGAYDFGARREDREQYRDVGLGLALSCQGFYDLHDAAPTVPWDMGSRGGATDGGK